MAGPAVTRATLGGHHGAMRASCRSSRVATAIAVVGVVVVALAATAAGASGALWNIARIGAPAPADGVLIAVVDTGVDAAHPAFGGRVVGQKDFTGDGKQGDPFGHGTHVAGTAAGGTLDCGDGPAAIGVAPTARVLSVRVLDATGRGSTGDVADGIRYAADQGAAVINLSLGDDITIVDGGSQTMLDAIDYAWSKGSIPVLAAGNAYLVGGMFGSGYGDIPAVVVTATTRQDRKAGYATSVGSARWGIAAPGGDGSGTAEGDVLSAYPGNRCAVMAGTSMAAPHVAGALAVLRAEGLSPQGAVDRILSTARSIGSESTYGAGLLDLAAARGVSAPPTTAPPPAPAPDPSAPAPASTPGGAPTTPASGGDDPAPRDGTPPTTGPGSASVTDPAPGDDAPTERDAVEQGDGDERPRSTASDDEAATGVTVVPEEGDEGVPAPLAVGAGVALAGLWVLSGRALLGLRR